MIQEHIERIRTKLEGTSGLSEQTKAELLALLEQLQSETTDLSSKPATTEPGEKSGKMFEDEIDGLNRSVDGLEATHPQIVETVNRIAVTLSNMGI